MGKSALFCLPSPVGLREASTWARTRNRARAPVVLEARAVQPTWRPLLHNRPRRRISYALLHRSFAQPSAPDAETTQGPFDQLRTYQDPWFIAGIDCERIALSVETKLLPIP